MTITVLPRYGCAKNANVRCFAQISDEKIGSLRPQMLRDLKRHRKVETLVQRNRLLEVGFPNLEISLGERLRPSRWRSSNVDV